MQHLTPRRRRRMDHAQGLAEYGLLVSIIAVAMIALLVFIGGSLSGYLTVVGNAV